MIDATFLFIFYQSSVNLTLCITFVKFLSLINDNAIFINYFLAINLKFGYKEAGYGKI